MTLYVPQIKINMDILGFQLTWVLYIIKRDYFFWKFYANLKRTDTSITYFLTIGVDLCQPKKNNLRDYENETAD